MREEKTAVADTPSRAASSPPGDTPTLSSTEGEFYDSIYCSLYEWVSLFFYFGGVLFTQLKGTARAHSRVFEFRATAASETGLKPVYENCMSLAKLDE